MIFIAGISIALFISALLLVKKNKSKSDLFLFLWMILNATHLTFFYLLYSKAIYEYPILLGLQFPLPLLHGVLLYYYVSSCTNQFPKRKLVALLHLIPTLLVVIYIIPFIILPPEQKMEVFRNEGKGYEIFQNILLFSVFFSGTVYVIWSSFLLRNHKKRIRNQFSNIEEISLKWLQFLTYGLGVIWSLAILSQNNILISIGVSIFVILIGFFGIQQKNIFNIHEKASSIIPSNNNEVEQTKTRNLEGIQTNQNKTEKYISSGLSDEKAIKHYERAIEIDNYFNMSRMNLALIYYQIGRVKESEALYLKVVEQEPEFSSSYYMLGLLYNETGDTEKSMKYLELATKKEPRNSSVFYNYALMLQKAGDNKKSIEIIDAGLEFFPNTERLCCFKTSRVNMV